MAYLNGNKVFLYGERTVDANLTTKTIKQNGTYNASSDNADGYSSVTVDVALSTREYFARVVDYDGTILKEQWLNDGEEFTMPDPPSHNGLVFDGWSATQTITDNKIIINNNDFMAGPMYYTSSGYTELDIELDIVSGLILDTVNLTGNYVDWGDGSSIDTTAGVKSHTYESYGRYTIKTNSDLTTFLFNNTAVGNKYNHILRAIRFKNGATTLGTTALNYSDNLTSITIPNSVTSIATRALSECGSLATIIIPNSVTSIGGAAFEYCSNLSTIIIPNSLTSISAVFTGCAALVSITIPSSVTDIGSSTFRDCGSLANVTIPSGVTSIGVQIFSYCYRLKNIIIPNNVNSIGIEAFRGCSRLTSITIPNGVTSISNSLFRECSRLFDVTFLGNITSIGNYVMNGNNRAVKIDLTHCTSVPTLSNYNSFYNTSASSKILVPASLYDTWITTTNWSALASRIVPVDNT